MASMNFMSCPTVTDGMPKFVKFDSSPGRAIAKRLGDGLWDERTYRSVLREGDGETSGLYDVYLRRNPPLDEPDKVMPEVKVGTLRYEKPSW